MQATKGAQAQVHASTLCNRGNILCEDHMPCGNNLLRWCCPGILNLLQKHQAWQAASVSSQYKPSVLQHCLQAVQLQFNGLHTASSSHMKSTCTSFPHQQHLHCLFQAQAACSFATGMAHLWRATKQLLTGKGIAIKPDPQAEDAEINAVPSATIQGMQQDADQRGFSPVFASVRTDADGVDDGWHDASGPVGAAEVLRHVNVSSQFLLFSGCCLLNYCIIQCMLPSSLAVCLVATLAVGCWSP
jgi:hypothetical protein